MTETLVTGATGFVGPHLVSALRVRGCDVRVLALPGEDATQLEQHATVCRGDVRRPETLVAAFRGIDTVFHLAAIHGLWRSRQDYRDVNVTGTENVCRAALAAGIRRLIAVSSWAVYGMGVGQAVDERFPLRPGFDIYAITKAVADQLVQRYIVEHHLPAVIVRPGTMFGPGDRVNFGRIADRLMAGKAIIIGSGRNALPFVYVSDAVEGMILAGFRDVALGRIYNLSNDEPLTQKEMWHAVAEEIGTRPPRLHVPYYALYALAFAAEVVVSSDHPRMQPLLTRLGVKMFGTDNRHVINDARRELGYQPRVSVRDGVHRAAMWYLQQASLSTASPTRDRASVRDAA